MFIWVEEGRRGLLLLCGLSVVLFGITLWVCEDFCPGMVIYLGMSFLVVTGRQAFLQWRLPKAARLAARKALAYFQLSYPEVVANSVAVRGVEAQRIVICIYHGRGSPSPRRLFAVSLPELDQVTELDRAGWQTPWRR
jgi:hypothetical protein